MTDNDSRTIEETDSGWLLQARTQILYKDESGRFVSREAFVAERNAEIRDGDGDSDSGGTDTTGYGDDSYGGGGYGGDRQ
jgi:hypothetical protein